MEKGQQQKEEFSTEVGQLDEALNVLDSSLSHIKWRLQAAARRRLQIDILALCTGMRPVVMVDYGGKMPELQERLCALLKLSQKESSIFEHLRVMIVEDMIYLLHIRGLVEHVQSSLNSELQLLFVDLEQDPPKVFLWAFSLCNRNHKQSFFLFGEGALCILFQMITQFEKNPLGMQFLSILKRFSVLFPVEGMKNDFSSCPRTDETVKVKSPVNDLMTSQSSYFIDFSSCLQDTQVTVPTLNGWLLGYPVVYAFGKEHISEAVRNLSTKSLHIFKISVCRNSSNTKGSQMEELLSFSVPYGLSLGGSNEQWAKAYLAHMQIKWERCKQAWRSLQMDVSECYPQAIVL